MISGMQVVSECEMGVMSSLFVAAAGVMVGRFFVMECGLFMVLGRFSMMVYGFLGHRLGGSRWSDTVTVVPGRLILPYFLRRVVPAF
jgi:hypothetical protein